MRQRRDHASRRTGESQDGLQRSAGEGSSELIYALMQNPASQDSLEKQFHEHGFQVRSFRSRAQLEIGVSKAEPAAIIVDGQLPDGPKLIGVLRKRIGTAPKMIYLSAKNTLEEQVRVRYAGVEHYLTKPVRKATLVECLNQVTRRSVAPNARVLVISDQPLRSAAYERALIRVGLEVSVLNQPLHVLEPLIELKPDLLLIDLSDAEFSGEALGDTLRHYHSSASLPIVYVGEPYRHRLTSTDIGSEDYVEAGCSESYLTELIISRIRRNHLLSAIISRDPLTGFWTENAFSEHFDTILGLAIRTRDALSAIVMDIDRFRDINRCTGYMTGNAVLKSIATCIFERLRYSDIVGRYGSGRIAMALPGADLRAAWDVANDIRRQIEALKHVAGTSLFSVNVSMGIAGYRFDSMSGDIPFLVAQMVESANQALEAAKRRGGSCIEIYRPELVSPAQREEVERNAVA